MSAYRPNPHIYSQSLGMDDFCFCSHCHTRLYSTYIADDRILGNFCSDEHATASLATAYRKAA